MNGKSTAPILPLVRGITPESGTITAPIGRKEGSVLERQVDFGQGEYACTHYRRLAVKEIFPKNTFSREPLSPDAFSLIALRLDTGRTHQIRVHMSYLGYPLIGDFLYNPDFSLTKKAGSSCLPVKIRTSNHKGTALLYSSTSCRYANAVP